MQQQRLFLLICLTSTIFLFCASTELCRAEQYGSTGENMLTADVLKMKLYAKTEAEKEYCDFVIRKRNEKILPDRILFGAYRRAVQEDKGRRFAYFRRALEILCKEAKIDLKDTDEKKFSFSMTFPQFNQTKAITTTTTKHNLASFFGLFKR